MERRERTLSRSAAQAWYDRFGGRQDSQGFYEDPAIDDLVAHAGFEGARNVFEFGCGTGKLAAHLMSDCLPSSARYTGCDLSPVMVGLATKRLESFGERASVVASDGDIRFPCADGSVDLVLAVYVLDLLPKADIRDFFREARRVLVPGGRLCLASLTRGVNLPTRMVSSLWAAVFRIRPSLVGGCRPIRLEGYVDPETWRTLHRRIVRPFGVPSEALVLAVRGLRSASAGK